MSGWEPFKDETPEIALLAIEDRFVAEYLRGAAPRLSEYISQYPQYAGELALFVADFLADRQGVPETRADEPIEGASMLSGGMRRALALIANAAAPAEMAGEDVPRLVAEATADYAAALSLADLRARSGLDVEDVAARADLPADIIVWLDGVTVMKPEPLVAVIERLARALGVENEDVARSLALRGQGRQSCTAEMVMERILNAPALTGGQRARWQARLQAP